MMKKFKINNTIGIFLEQMITLLESKGYKVRSFNVSGQSGKELYRFKIYPAPPGRGTSSWEWVDCEATDKNAMSYVKNGQTLYRKSKYNSGFSSFGQYGNTTLRLNRENIENYINELPTINDLSTIDN